MSLSRIVNASPLILLSTTGQLDLLRSGGADVVTHVLGRQTIQTIGTTDNKWDRAMPSLAVKISGSHFGPVPNAVKFGAATVVSPRLS